MYHQGWALECASAQLMADALMENRTPDFNDTASSNSVTEPVDTAAAPGLDFGPRRSDVPPLNSGTSSNSVLRHTHRWLRCCLVTSLRIRLFGAFARGADAALSVKQALISAQLLAALSHSVPANKRQRTT